MAYKQTFAHVTGRPFLSVDPYEQPKPVQVWATPEGASKPRPTGEQAVDANGIPLWTINASVLLLNFGETESELITIQFASKERPKSLPADLMTPQQAR